MCSYPQKTGQNNHVLNLMNFDLSSKISGSRFVVLKGMLAKPNSILYGYTFENNNILTSTFGDNNVHV